MNKDKTHYLCKKEPNVGNTTATRRTTGTERHNDRMRLITCKGKKLKTIKIKTTYMKILQSSVFRAICAILIGILLINNPDNTVKGITIAIGLLFLVSGAISCAAYLSARTHASETEIYDAQGRLIVTGKPTFPIVGIGSVLLGLILAIMPGLFVKSLMYLLGAIIILGAINQFMVLVNAQKMFRVPLWFWICPSVIFLTGLLVLIKPMDTASLPLLIIGWCLLLYGATECVNAFKIYRERKRIESSLTIKDKD